MVSFKTWFENQDNKIMFFNRDREHYGFMSNFYPAPFALDDEEWASVEHYYQAMKSEDPKFKETIRNAATPGKAKRLGSDTAKQSLFKHGFVKDHNWDKIGIMRKALIAKFTQNPELRQKLLNTGTAELIEDNPRDEFWGIGSGSGMNELGKLLMQLRGQL